MRQNKFADFAQKVQGGAGAYGYFPNKNKGADIAGKASGAMKTAKSRGKMIISRGKKNVKGLGNAVGGAIGKAAGFVKGNPVKAAAGLGALAAAGGLGMAGYKALNGSKKKKY